MVIKDFLLLLYWAPSQMRKLRVRVVICTHQLGSLMPQRSSLCPVP
jgi:hypothetical protein